MASPRENPPGLATIRRASESLVLGRDTTEDNPKRPHIQGRPPGRFADQIRDAEPYLRPRLASGLYRWYRSGTVAA